MNASVPGGHCVPPIKPQKTLLDVLKEIMRAGLLRGRARVLLERVIGFFETPGIDARIDRRLAGGLRDVAEGTALEWEHKSALHQAADRIEQISKDE